MSGTRLSKTCKQINLRRDSLLYRLSKNFKCLVAKYVMSGTVLEHVFLSRVYA